MDLSQLIIMEIETLSCNNCGAPLKVPDIANFVRCNHCDSQLAIRRKDSVAYTELLQSLHEKTDSLHDKTDSLLDQMQSLAYQNAIARVDREWEREKKQYYIRNKEGHEFEPTMGSLVFSAIVLTIMVVIFFTILSKFPPGMGAGPMFALMIVVGIGMVCFQYFKVKEYASAKRSYQRKRKRINKDQALQQDRFFSDLDSLPTAEDYLREISEEM